MAAERPEGCSRRAALRLALGAPALAPLALLAGCGADPEPPPGTSVELVRLPEGERVVVMHGEEPVELLRTGASVRARSLWCTHMGCRVKWEPQGSVYLCPCHGGIFDSEGRPIAGPPTRRLRAIPTVRRGGELVLLRPESPPASG